MKTKRMLLLTMLLLGVFLGLEAQAFHNPNTGRWLSRNPLGEADCPNVYAFVVNAPVLHYDTLGLFGCRPDPCADPCGDAKRKKIVLPGVAGGIVCCNGKPHACAWDPGGPTGGKNKKAKKIIEQCIKVHETKHIPDVVCPPVPDFSIGGPGKGKDTHLSECEAYKAEKGCLKAAIHECDGDPQCISQVMADQRDVREKIEYYCAP